MAKKRVKNDYSDSLNFLASEYDNIATYNDYLDRMTKICLSMFEWENLPDTMDERYLERCLFFQGKAALLKDADYGFINTMAAQGGFISIYGLPTQLHCYSIGQIYAKDKDVYTGINTDVDPDNACILVKNNWSMVPTAATIQLFAARLTEAQRTIDININAQRTPIILLGTDKQKLTLENLFQEYQGGSPVIYGDNDIITNETFKAVDMNAPYVTDRIQDYKKEIWNEFLEFIGVNTIDIDKKERLIKGEANANNEFINLNLQSYLIPRQKAADEFNKLYGTNIKVKVRSDLGNLIKFNESTVSDYNDDGLINGSTDKDGDSNG